TDEPSEETPVTGATAGLALAAVALAGAAVVATKKNK
ncbi:MAG: NPXTG-anchored protein, partial [Oscillospiraceae bacterium]|nr:NPXTG-anchored protein [Oscillospiraceae bacterium]